MRNVYKVTVIMAPARQCWCFSVVWKALLMFYCCVEGSVDGLVLCGRDCHMEGSVDVLGVVWKTVLMFSVVLMAVLMF